MAQGTCSRFGIGTKDQGAEAERTENRKSCILSSLVALSLPITQEFSSLLGEVVQLYLESC